ncbi:hypothetical protein [Arthrobacter sp. PAMC25564]|uniref:hypothetical protein n=1 Tax=Arthrobacter sp. PAMC25564 TaxID=2565366 RepID=UPI001F0D0E29|nr:hypothetical protein [Arthrobacter sp. PAMC25564]
MTQEELIEAITHVTPYAGWPRACLRWASPSNSSQTSSKENHEHRTLCAHLEKPGGPIRRRRLAGSDRSSPRV